MRKTIRETIEWHSKDDKYPITNKTCLLQTNDGIFWGFWDKRKQKWGTATHYLNSDTHVSHWAYYPRGVKTYINFDGIE